MSGVDIAEEEDRVNDALLAEDTPPARAAASSATVDGYLIASHVDSDDDSDGGGAPRRPRPAPVPAVADIEDLVGGGTTMPSSATTRPSALAAATRAGEGTAVLPEMVTPAQRKALTKEGYAIIGSHSAVKLCRWTKAQLRGRGGCYKHTFYGIESYGCMEATPALACANK